MITVHHETIRTETQTWESRKGTQSREITTIEVSAIGKRARVQCYETEKCIDIFGLAVRFRTGTKVWPASAVYWKEGGSVNNLRPNIDKFNGQFCQLVGFFEDFEESANRSQHNAVA